MKKSKKLNESAKKEEKTSFTPTTDQKESSVPTQGNTITPPSKEQEKPEDKIKQLMDSADVYVFSGPMYYDRVDALRNVVFSKQKHKNRCILFLTTFGGDADSAYRLTAALKEVYGKFDVVIAGLCKSAGTLTCIAADNLYFGRKGELGPLDIQMSRRKGDDQNEIISGLDIFLALEILIKQNATDAFIAFSTQLQRTNRISIKASMEIASKMVAQIFAPIMDQINPLDLGEMHRSLSIAKGYVKVMLSDNFKSDLIDKLATHYPCHSFVIDKKQSKEFFNRVFDVDSSMSEIIRKYSSVLEFPHMQGVATSLEALISSEERLIKGKK